jgi:NitT/TauT family transport system substrate-binding protein
MGINTRLKLVVLLPVLMPKTIIALLVGVFVLTGIVGCSGTEDEEATIGVSPQPVSAPVYVAYEKGFFKREGLRVTLQPYASGKHALNAVIERKAHFATVAETPIVFAGLKAEKIYVVATIANSDKYMKIIARKDRGISAPAELKGKKIGVSPGTNGEFFLHAYLTINGVAQKDVQAVDVPPGDMVDTLVTGKVDAVSTWVPFTTMLEKQLGGNGLILEDPGVYEMTWNVAVTREFARNNPQRIKKFLRAVIRADSFIKDRPDEARAITAKYIGMRVSALNEIWDLYNFSTLLDESLILNLEDQARWVTSKEADGISPLPNFLDFIYTDGLRVVKPEAVAIAGE